VLDSGCTNHMIGEKKMFTSFEKNDTTSDSITFVDSSQCRVLSHGKIAIKTEHSISKVLLVNHWTIIYCLYHNFVRWTIIVYSLIRV
jgi:hypothetical protein